MKIPPKDSISPRIALTNNIEINNGAHIMYTFSNPEKYLENAISFISTGLLLGNGVVFIDEKPTFDIVLQHLTEKGVDEEKLDKIIFFDNVEFYASNEIFSINRVVNTFSKLIHPYISEGIPLRTWAKVKWLKDQCCLLDNLSEFELEADSFVNQVKSFSICAYDGSELSANQQLEIMKSHPYMMTDLELFPSSLYHSELPFPSIFMEKRDEETISNLKNEFQNIHNYYKNLIEVMPDAVFVTSNEEIVYANKAATELLDCELVQLLDKRIWEIIHLDFHETVKERTVKIQFGDKAPLIEQKLQNFKGQTINVEAASFPFFFDNMSKPTTISIVRNIDERRLLQKKISNQIKFNRTVFDSLQMGLIVVEDNQINMINEMACNILEFENSDTTEERSVTEQHKITTKIFTNLDEKYKLIEIVDKATMNLNIESKHINGRTIEIDFIPISFDEELYTYVWVIRDITYRKMIEENLKEAKLNAEKSNHMKTVFLSQMSHDLRTPLNTIQGFTQILLSDHDRNEKERHKLQRIHGASIHLLELIKELLDFSAIEAGAIKLYSETIQLKSIIDDCVNSIQEFPHPQVSFFIKPIKADLYIHTDPVRLKQILNNLLTNALKYNKPDGKVHIYVESEPSNIVIYVADTGIGIPEDEIPYIFEPFYRSKKNMENWTGAGLGLAIVKNLTKIMNGNCGVFSQEGIGTTFWVRFNKLDVNNTDISCKKENTLSTENKPIVGKRVLYIDDNRDNVELMQAMLEMIGDICLFPETTGRTGLLKALEMKPDLILLDLSLPDMTGIEVLKRLKMHENTKEIPVYIVSADAFETSIKEALANGCTDYITKPIDINQLRSAISNS
jgi:PAS domain S-box-containing protein